MGSLNQRVVRNFLRYTLPNALLLTEPVVNETRILSFEWREILFSIGPDEDWREVESVLRAEAEAIVAEYQHTLDVQLAEMTDRFAFHPIQSQPAVLFRSENDGKVVMKVRMPMPAREIAVLADRMHRAFLSRST